MYLYLAHRAKLFVWSIYYRFHLFFAGFLVPRKKNILFYPINGLGLGHLSRLLAVAKSLRKLDSEYNPIFITSCSCLHLIRRAGFLYYHLPSSQDIGSKIASSQVSWLLFRRLNEVLVQYHPSAVIFDGSVPCDALNCSLRGALKLRKFWIRRQQRIEHQLRFQARETWFDSVLEPGEAGSVQGGIFPPVICVDKDEAFSREEARLRLGVPEGAKVVYVQLGVDTRPVGNALFGKILKLFNGQSEWFVVSAFSPLSMTMPAPVQNGTVLHDYPNAKYFNAVDLAVSAAGYNTFHELMYFGVPTIFVPFEGTGADDQLLRAERAQKAGAAMVVRESLAEDSFVRCFKEALVQVGANSEIMAENARRLVPVNGADVLATEILNSL